MGKKRIIIGAIIGGVIALGLIGWRTYQNGVEYEEAVSESISQTKAYKQILPDYLEDSLYYTGFRSIDVIGGGSSCEIEYHTPVQNVGDVRRRDPLASFEEIRPTLVYEMQQRGGTISVTVRSSTRDGARPGNYRIVVEDGESVILTELLSGDDPVNSDSPGKVYRYCGFARVNLPRRVNFPLKISIGNLITGDVDVFTVVAE